MRKRAVGMIGGIRGGPNRIWYAMQVFAGFLVLLLMGLIGFSLLQAYGPPLSQGTPGPTTDDELYMRHHRR